MRYISPQPNWPDSWKKSCDNDRQEMYGQIKSPGYTYQYENRREIVMEFIETIPGKKTKILDIAAAQGNYTLALAELGYEVTWNDIRSDLIDYVKLKWESGAVHFLPGNILDFDIGPIYDIVLAMEIIEHVAHPDVFLKKIASFVKPSGHIILTTPNGKYIRNKLPKFSEYPNPSDFTNVQFKPDADGHIFLLHEEEIISIANMHGLSAIKFLYHSNFLSNGHLKTRFLNPFLPHKVIELLEHQIRSSPLLLRRKLHSGMAILLKKI